MKSKREKLDKEKRRKARTRARIFGTASRPRLSVYRSNKHLFLQLIDDEAGKTLLSLTDDREREEGGKKNKAFEAGKKLAELAKKTGVKSVVFDRGGYLYHGRVKAVADGAREGGLIF